VKFGDLMPNADLPCYTDYLDAWIAKHKPKYPPLNCSHDDSVMTKKIDRLGREHYYLRCSLCARRLDTFRKKDKLVTLHGKTAPLDDEFVDRIRCDSGSAYNVKRSVLHAEYVQIRAEYERAEIGVWWQYHRLYMASARWKMLRAAVLERDNHRCQECGSTQNLECHHTTYKRFGAEEMSDLTTYCNSCHQNHHIDQDMERERERIWRENQLIINQQSPE
jgi:hypothetical protein